MAQGRAKKPHKKVKTGCLTCRKRRIKCDEGKPRCVQCTSSLRRCEGYQSPQAWLFKPRASPEAAPGCKALALADDKHTPLVHSISPLASVGGSKEKRFFQLWMEQAAPVFSCYFGHSFWSQLLPKLSLDSSRPAVKHMLLATSSLSESILFESGVPIDKNVVYQSHYTKAIQETASSPRIETVLMACLLFACCEFMQGSIAAGLGHIYSGLNIIHEWSISDNGSKEATLIINTLTPISLAYIDKAPTYGIGIGDSLPCGARFASLVTPNVELPFVGRIDAIRRAHFALDGIGHHVARKADWRRARLGTFSHEKIELLLADWQIEFDGFEKRLSDARRERLYTSIQLLRIAHTMLSIMLQASAHSAGERGYQDFENQFAWIVGQFDYLALTWAKDPSRKFISGREDIEHHFGYIAPLFFTATKCRNIQIRSTALWHLRHLKVVENNWTSCTAYEIASKIVDLEDSRTISKLSVSPESVSSKTPSSSYDDYLIRPIEAFLSDTTPMEATLVYTYYSYKCESQSSDGERALGLQENVDLKQCPAASKVYWPLNSVVRIGGYQSGLIKPLPTGCECGSLSQIKGLLIPRLKAS